MYAVIRTGGKQYRVQPNDVIKVEKLTGEAGETLVLDDVLLVGDGDNVTIGAPGVDGASVQATVLEQTRAAKITIFKKKRRKNYRRKNGHRQHLTVLRITEIAAA
ncbi:MAG: 50S ribosomal protein L21 [Alphaproteobacteria bacterium]